MISVDELEKTILELESRDTTYATCERLAWLYIVRDHLTGAIAIKAPNRSAQSEFLEAATAADVDMLMGVLDEHFEIIKAVYPKEYAAVISKIKDL